MRVRKAKLIPREEYMRMLNMSLTEITRFIEETQYKQEIDEQATAFKGINLIEIALSWNLAKEYQKIQDITPGTLKQFTQAYLRSWDIQNVLNILRGRMHGVKTGRIKEIIIPAGSLNTAELDRMLAEESADRVIELLKDHRMFPVIAREFPEAKATGSFAKMENDLYKQFYSEVIRDARSGVVAGGDQFLAYIRLEIDIKNVKTLFRLRADAFKEDVQELYIPGGSLSVQDFANLNAIKDANEFIEAVKTLVRSESLDSLLEELKGEKKVRDIEIRLTRVQLEQMEKMSRRNPFSIHPILVYLEEKKYEVSNLRALARGKESELPSEKIANYLVM
jgi:V/A-type H+-transporting ATPase subunit C